MAVAATAAAALLAAALLAAALLAAALLAAVVSQQSAALLAGSVAPTAKVAPTAAEATFDRFGADDGISQFKSMSVS